MLLGAVVEIDSLNYLLSKRQGKEMPRNFRGWWYTLVIPEFRRLGQEHHKCKAGLGYIVRSVSKQMKE